EELPDHVWLPLLALEDTRFFKHIGVDGRSIARAIVANFKAGQSVEGASTITQQLIKNRDLSPKRTLSRKISEAARALLVDTFRTKEVILQSYLNTVYYGHVDGVAVHGLGTASQVYFSKDAADLTLEEAALLAAIVQGPNGLSPIRHPDAAKERRDRAISRMVELGWLDEDLARETKAKPIVLQLTSPEPHMATHFRSWTVKTTKEKSRALDRGWGLVIETTLDPQLQRHAENTVEAHLASLRQNYPLLRQTDLSAALVAVDVKTGAVLAYVGGDPANPGEFDRAREAERQPGSAIKPLLLLEALETCGDNPPLNPASQISDRPLTVELPSGKWEPHNYDHKNHGNVSVRTALVKSYNIPFVRIAEHCGMNPTARRVGRAGISLPKDPPPSFVLGSIETTPLDLAGAFTVFNDGRSVEPRGVSRIHGPKGRRIAAFAPKKTRAASPATAYLIRDMMDDVVDEGTGRAAAISGLEVAGKTGSSSNLRDAWFVGQAEGVVTVVWV
ncbi:MAG: hypothetical protein HN348_32355, partial [Proteobacteria bacterium]|nr:hypothetical protein [Pseudomonadota bacterium]